MRVLSVITAVLSSLLLAAHFLHADQSLIAAACVALPIALLIRRRWATQIVQLALLTGALVWLWTMVQLAETFQEIGRSPMRMIFILSSVAGFTVLSALLLQLWIRRADDAGSISAQPAA